MICPTRSVELSPHEYDAKLNDLTGKQTETFTKQNVMFSFYSSLKFNEKSGIKHSVAMENIA